MVILADRIGIQTCGKVKMMPRTPPVFSDFTPSAIRWDAVLMQIRRDRRIVLAAALEAEDRVQM